MDARYFDEAFESKNLRRIKSSLSWLTVERGLRLALQNCKPSTRKSKGITPNARHVMDVLLWEALGSQSISIEFRNKEEIAVRAGVHRNEVREALEELRENGLISYDDAAQHKVSILIQKAVEFWKYPHRVDPQILATVRAGFRFDTDPQEPVLAYQGVVLQGFEPSLRETQHRNAMEIALKQIETEPEEPPSNFPNTFDAMRSAVNGPGSEHRSKPKEIPSVSTKAEGTPSNSQPPLSLKRSPTASALSLEDLKLQLQSQDEREAMEACAGILGDEVWEGTGIAGNRPIGDGGKWRLRWRSHRSKVVRVFGDILQARLEGKTFGKPGGHAEWLWKQFA